MIKQLFIKLCMFLVLSAPVANVMSRCIQIVDTADLDTTGRIFLKPQLVWVASQHQEDELTEIEKDAHFYAFRNLR